MGKMIKQYEAIYKKGQLQWIGSPPMVIENRRVMVSLADEGDEPKSTNVPKLLSETRGILGDRMTMEDIDADIRTMRDEWTRKKTTCNFGVLRFSPVLKSLMMAQIAFFVFTAQSWGVGTDTNVKKVNCDKGHTITSALNLIPAHS